MGPVMGREGPVMGRHGPVMGTMGRLWGAMAPVLGCDVGPSPIAQPCGAARAARPPQPHGPGTPMGHRAPVTSPAPRSLWGRTPRALSWASGGARPARGLIPAPQDAGPHGGGAAGARLPAGVWWAGACGRGGWGLGLGRPGPRAGPGVSRPESFPPRQRAAGRGELRAAEAMGGPGGAGGLRLLLLLLLLGAGPTRGGGALPPRGTEGSPGGLGWGEGPARLAPPDPPRCAPRHPPAALLPPQPPGGDELQLGGPPAPPRAPRPALPEPQDARGRGAGDGAGARGAAVGAGAAGGADGRGRLRRVGAGAGGAAADGPPQPLLDHIVKPPPPRLQVDPSPPPSVRWTWPPGGEGAAAPPRCALRYRSHGHRTWTLVPEADLEPEGFEFEGGLLEPGGPTRCRGAARGRAASGATGAPPRPSPSPPTGCGSRWTSGARSRRGGSRARSCSGRPAAPPGGPGAAGAGAGAGGVVGAGAPPGPPVPGGVGRGGGGGALDWLRCPPGAHSALLPGPLRPGARYRVRVHSLYPGGGAGAAPPMEADAQPRAPPAQPPWSPSSAEPWPSLPPPSWPGACAPGAAGRCPSPTPGTAAPRARTPPSWGGRPVPPPRSRR
ncbi:uncharacterized protein LOC142073917 isoform X3 [Calonectris borealis]|uniref:uncharacterized protein LOC142073917 isoform X3 n=1 Tax=Calonectris borealis TaxID=1323832 RepID=UPI003F4C45FE